MDNILSLIFLLIVSVISFRKRKESIIFWYSIWCTFILIDYKLNVDYFVQLSEKFDIFFFEFLFVFCITYFLVRKLGDRFHIHINLKFNAKIISYKLYKKISIFVAAVSFFAFSRALYSIPIIHIREMIAHRQISFYVGISFPIVAGWMYFNNCNNMPRKEKILSQILLFLLAIISTSKIFLVLALLYAIPWYTDQFRIQIKQFMIYGIITIMTLLLWHIFTGRLAGGSGSGFQRLIYTMNGYLLGGIAAFQLFLDGVNIGGFIRTGRWVGNVATAFTTLYAERTTWIFILRTFFIGIMYAHFDKRDRKDFLRIYAVFPLFFIFFDDLFIKSIVQWVLFIAVDILIRNFVKDDVKLSKAELISGRAFTEG